MIEQDDKDKPRHAWSDPRTGRFNATTIKEVDRPNKFHDHLDMCAHCQRNPFSLCSVGANLLREVISA
jgi:hypothetical protein